MDTLFQDVRYALRLLRKSALFSTLALLTIALGIGSATAIFSVVDGVLIQPLPYPHADRLVSVHRTFPHWRSDPARRRAGRTSVWPTWSFAIGRRSSRPSRSSICVTMPRRACARHSCYYWPPQHCCC
jgi:hypothetical protein